MADNFNLRQFLSENKLTKNTQLLKEEEAPQGADISGYWVLYSGMNAPRFLQFIKMFPSEQEAQEALENAPKTYGSHVLRDNWGIMSAQEWLEDGYELDSRQQGHPDYQSPKRLTPDERRAADAEFNRIRQDFYEQKQTTNKMTSREKYLTRLVENALGLEGHGDDNVYHKLEKRGDQPAQQAPTYSEGEDHYTDDLENKVSNDDAYGNAFDTMEEGEEMVQKEPLPKYENIEKLMKEIEEGTNKAMYEYKMKRMMEIAEMLEAKVSSLEEGEHAEYTDKKAINQMRKDIAALRKGEEKLRKEFDKKFNKKEKTAAPKKEAEAEKPTLQEGTFDLRKFLTENKLTTNSKTINEDINENADMGEKMQFFMDFIERYSYQVPAAEILEMLEDEYDIPQNINMQVLEKAVSELDLAINDIYTAVFESDNY